jgi:hypothetical protein
MLLLVLLLELGACVKTNYGLSDPGSYLMVVLKLARCMVFHFVAQAPCLLAPT